MQIGLIKALGGGFDATQTGLVAPTDAPASKPRTAATAAATERTHARTTQNSHERSNQQPTTIKRTPEHIHERPLSSPRLTPNRATTGEHGKRKR